MKSSGLKGCFGRFLSGGLRSKSVLRRLAISFIVVFLFCLSAVPSGALNLIVDDLGDLPDSNLSNPVCATSGGKCTLRAAISQINFTCDASNTIDFSSTLSYPGTILLTSSLPAINCNISINGPGSDRLTIDGQNLYKIFGSSSGSQSLAISGMRLIRGQMVSGGAVIGDIGDSVNLKQMIFEDNNATVYGGAVYCNQCASLSISHSRFTNNSAIYGGGGVYATVDVLTVDHTVFEGNTQSFTRSDLSGGGMKLALGAGSITDSVFDGNATGGSGGGLSASGSQGWTLSILDSSFSGNSAVDAGGGIDLEGAGSAYSGSAVLERVTVSGNTEASMGGGIYILGDVLVLIANNTISGNSSSSYGGGIYNGGALQLLNVTLSGNHAATSGGALFNAVTVNAVNTIFASSTGSSNCAGPINGTNSHNIDFGGPVPSNSCGAAITADPVLESLAYNGGPTQTMAPGAGSAAIDAGDSGNYPATDQRGWPRPYGAAPDIGAVEERPAALLTVNRSGNGTVTSAPVGISCSTGCSSDSSLFMPNTSVSLYALPDPGTDIFSPGWSGSGCGSAVSMTADRNCTATFTHCAGNPVKWLTTYSSITDAYAARATSVFVTASNRMEFLDLDDTFQFTIHGGYDCGFINVVDYTYINGRLFVINGSLVVDRVVIF